MTWDIDEAGRESFPASDPPAWGSSHAAPSAASIAQTCAPRRRRWPIALALALAAVALAVRYRRVLR